MSKSFNRWLLAAALAVAYFATAKLGIELSVSKGVVTPVWIPTGLALAAVVVFGARAWPGIALGAFVANATSDISLWVAAMIAVGNTLEALVGAYLLRRVGFDRRLPQVRDVLWLVVIGAALCTTIAATNGTLALWLGNEIEAANVASRWSLWWFGDAMGSLLVAPLLLVIPDARSLVRDARTASEALVLTAGLIGAGLYVFVGGNWRYPYVLFPFLIWAALRFKQIGASLAIVVITAIGVIGTVDGSVPLGGASVTESVQILQALLAVVAVSVYVLAATLHERDEAREKLKILAGNLAEAQTLARLGSWEWDIANDRVEWSDEMFRIYGYEPGEFTVTFEKAMERVASEDRDRIQKNLDGAVRDGAGTVIEYRIERPDGPRTLRGKGVTEYGAEGKPVRMAGTVQDVTEQLELEQRMHLLRAAEERHAQALELNDTIVQGLAAAKAALDLDLPEKEREYIEATLVRARRIVGDLLGDGDRTPQPGAFVRAEAARVTRDPARATDTSE